MFLLANWFATGGTRILEEYVWDQNVDVSKGKQP
jgi:hypothetical protein